MINAVHKKYPETWHMVVHGDGYQRAGIPDLLFCHNGHFVAVEVKHQKPGESVEHLLTRVSVRQKNELNKLAEAGATAVVAWSVQQVLDLFEEIDRTR